MEVSYQRGAFGLNRIGGESNENMHGKFGLPFKSEGMNCAVVEVLKCNTMWFGHMARMEGEKFSFLRGLTRVE